MVCFSRGRMQAEEGTQNGLPGTKHLLGGAQEELLLFSRGAS